MRLRSGLVGWGLLRGGVVRGLTELDLSDNALDGAIPANLDDEFGNGAITALDETEGRALLQQAQHLRAE